jgi:hypothetical protein
MYLARLANGTTYRELSHFYDISDAYCTRIVRKVSLALRAAFNHEVAWPSRKEALHSAHVFESRTGIRGCVAAADGTEIRLRPDAATRNAQYNHKQFHSVKLHAVVNSK